jgi:hypothetical protein
MIVSNTDKYGIAFREPVVRVEPESDIEQPFRVYRRSYTAKGVQLVQPVHDDLPRGWRQDHEAADIVAPSTGPSEAPPYVSR